MLEIDGLTVAYHGMPALVDASLVAATGERVGLVGPNGAGKSSLLKAISGTVDVTAGSIRFDGVDLTSLEPHRRVELGVVHVPEGRRIFGDLTVLENLHVGAYRASARAKTAERMGVVEVLFPDLMRFLKRPGAALSGGQQQMLAIARGLMACPRLLMLDEPSMGLSPLAAEQVFAGVARLEEFGEVTLLLVEQRAPEALELCERAYVFESGRIVSSGSSDELNVGGKLAEAYLGEIPPQKKI
jgi:branched-chain amino acid transport system ATP-binding protein